VDAAIFSELTLPVRAIFTLHHPQHNGDYCTPVDINPVDYPFFSLDADV
jgi:hypothetical protein